MEDIEIWKDIIGWEGSYKVSSFGRILSLGRIPNRYLKPFLCGRGYPTVKLHRNNKKQAVKVSRIVAIHFIDNPENKPQVNHIDGIKLHNYVSNLEWATTLENIRHAIEKLNHTHSACFYEIQKDGSVIILNQVQSRFFLKCASARIKIGVNEPVSINGCQVKRIN